MYLEVLMSAQPKVTQSGRVKYIVTFNRVVHAVAARLIDPDVALSYAGAPARTTGGGAAPGGGPRGLLSAPSTVRGWGHPRGRFVEQERRRELEERLENYIAVERMTGLSYNWALRHKIALLQGTRGKADAAGTDSSGRGDAERRQRREGHTAAAGATRYAWGGAGRPRERMGHDLANGLARGEWRPRAYRQRDAGGVARGRRGGAPAVRAGAAGGGAVQGVADADHAQGLDEPRRRVLFVRDHVYNFAKPLYTIRIRGGESVDGPVRRGPRHPLAPPWRRVAHRQNRGRTFSSDWKNGGRTAAERPGRQRRPRQRQRAA